MSTVVREILDQIVRLPEKQRAELHDALSRLEEDEWRSLLAEARHTARRRGIDDAAITRAVAAVRYGDAKR